MSPTFRDPHACRARLLPITTTWTLENKSKIVFDFEKRLFQQSDNDHTMQEPSNQPSCLETPNIDGDRADPVNASSSDDSISTHVGSSAGPSDEISSKNDLTSEVTGPPKPKRRPGKGMVSRKMI